MTAGDYRFGIRANRAQFLYQLLQVLFVGLALGMLRTVVPALAQSEFGVPRNSFLLLMAFVVAFGFVKAVLNFVAGRWSERAGRKAVLAWGWAVALPIPFMIYFARDWNWIVAATVLLGVNQGLTWSMTQTAKLDITTPEQRGLTIGLNEFAGYFGMALGGLVTAELATRLDARTALLVFGVAVVGAALALALTRVADTLPWAQAEGRRHGAPASPLSTAQVFARVSWRDARLFALSQAGHVEKFVDALVWVFYPVFLYQRGLSLAGLGWVVGVYGFVWGVAQLVTGHWSDRVGRRLPIVAGMWLCALGVALMPLSHALAGWIASAAVTGLGMALLYPTLSAGISDYAHPHWRGSAIGVYRFWRDLGYGIGALALGLVARVTHSIEAGFWLVAGAMLVSGLVVAWLLPGGRPHHA